MEDIIIQSLSSRVVSYLEMGEYEKQLSPETIKACRIDLRQFLDFTKGAWADKAMLAGRRDGYTVHSIPAWS